jgi:inhibitor of KinA sporulation pathway (predicted exonuclease)
VTIQPNTINVIDLEATCWENNDPPIMQRQEIIEIGIAVVHVEKDSCQITDQESLLITPCQSQMTDYCTSLTGFTYAELSDKGTTLKEAMDTLRNRFEAWKRPFASWGNFDRNQFQRDCDEKDVGYPFNTHINIKHLDALNHRLKEEKGLKTALNRRGLEFEGEHHSGEDDAYNAAKVLIDILN